MYDDNNDDNNDNDDSLLCCRTFSESGRSKMAGRSGASGRIYATKLADRPRERGGSRRCESEAKSVFIGNGVGLGQSATADGKPANPPPKTSLRLGPTRSAVGKSCVDECRRRKTEVRMRLRTIHPNPGPRGRSDQEKLRRREKRKLRRKANSERKKERRRQERLGKVKEELKVVTWNVQGMSLRGLWKRKAKTVARMAKEQEWDVVMLTEITAEGEGVVWLGRDEELAAIVHTDRAAILLRGEILKRWSEGGMMKKFGERVVSVKVDGVVLMSVYMPVWSAARREEIERVREVVVAQAGWSEREDILVIGGDMNSHIGHDSARGSTCGRFGLRTSNVAGGDFLDWLGANGWCWTNSFFNHKRRGTWFSNIHRRWYELDGFVMREDQRHRHARRMKTIGEASLSDHKPKLLLVDVSKRKWRRVFKSRKVPVVQWEALKNEQVCKRFEQEVDRRLNQEAQTTRREDSTRWSGLAGNLVEAAKITCGLKAKTVENEWMVGKEEEDRVLRNSITAAFERRNEKLEEERRGEASPEEVEEAREALKEARKEWKRERRRWEREWWDEVLVECERAAGRGDLGAMYKGLKKLGGRGVKKVTTDTTITTDGFKEQFSKVSAERFENSPDEIERAVSEAEDLRSDPRTPKWRDDLNTPPEREEILKEMGKMRDGAPGEDGARLGYILKAGGKAMDEVVELVRFMWLNSAETWEDSLKRGLIIPLFKKGDRNDPNNYRGVCLLSMGRRIVARIVAVRVSKWAEGMELLDDDQAGFRSGRSTADATQIMMRLQEDSVDLRKRGGAVGGGLVPSARLLDLRKAYPRVNKAALWQLLERYGLNGSFLRLLMDLHETTEYVVRGKEGNSEPWMPGRGLTEGCPSSPILFNVYHQAPMRVAKKQRIERAVADGRTAGIVMRWVPGSAFPAANAWERGCSDAVEVCVEKSLFADDTTAVGDKEELEVGIEVTKEAMGRYEERNNDGKEEVLDFGTEEGNKVRMLGCWMGWREDVKNRLVRAGRAWFKVRQRLVGSRLSKKKQARVVEACVETALLFDCQVRVWQRKEVSQLQSFMDRAYRYVWASGRKPPLEQMQDEHKNMFDVRRELGVQSVRWKIERRVLERIGHVMRMDDTRMTKACVLGWMKELEGFQKPTGKNRKTVSYWKKLLREAGIDTTDMARLTGDRREWKGLVRDRMKHVSEWERSRGHLWQGNVMERNEPPIPEVVFACRVCGKVCKSKGGLVNHRRRMHEISAAKKMFKCDACGLEVKKQSDLSNHAKVCGGAVASAQGKIKCLCGREYSKSYFAKHRRNCDKWNDAHPDAGAPAPRAPRAPCDKCGRWMRKDNMARHSRESCPG